MRIDRRAALKLSLLAGTAALSSSAHSQEASERCHSSVTPASRFYPIQYWSEAALELVALDHTIPGTLAVAPGPCASARALGLVHAAIADAVHYAYRTNYNPFFLPNWTRETIDLPAAFIGGCAFEILSFIFSTDRHQGALDDIYEKYWEFIGTSTAAYSSWGAGSSFGKNAAFRDRWNRGAILTSLIQDADKYQPEPGKHNVDPRNPDQRFYGVTWGQHPALVLEDAEKKPDGELAPPKPPELSPQEISFLRAKGALSPVDIDGHKARTQAETNVGLFWAYDGARQLGTPPVLYNRILWHYVNGERTLSIPEAARLLALCNLAMADAGIVAWGSKYFHKVWRPVRAIVDLNIDQSWHPYGAPRTNSGVGSTHRTRDTAQTLLGASSEQQIQSLRDSADMNVMRMMSGRSAIPYAQAAFTPNFPAYPSGHATFGGACFGMLHLFRKETLISDEAANRINLRNVRSGELTKCALDNFTGKPREEVQMRFNLIDDLIKGNDDSRLYLGVHWTFDSTEGSRSGRKIAERIHTKAYRPVP